MKKLFFILAITAAFTSCKTMKVINVSGEKVATANTKHIVKVNKNRPFYAGGRLVQPVTLKVHR